MGKNKAYKTMQRAKLGSSSAAPDEVEDGMSVVEYFGVTLWVLSYLSFPYSALSYLSIVPAPLRDAVYDFVAKRRYDWFGKEEDCIVLQELEMPCLAV
ncbi:hypothetical protein Droror1_Dr00012213 [Drosera rotundifolia]